MPSCFAACPGVKPASARVCAAETVSRSSGGRNTVARALGDEPTLEVGDCSKDMEHQFAGGRGRVDAFFEADQADVVRLEVLDRFEQFLEGAPEAGDTEAVAGAGMVDQRAQSWTLELSSRDHVNEDADGASLPQPVLLGGHILLSGRYAGIAKNIATVCPLACFFNVRFRDGLAALHFGPVQGTQIVSLSVSILWEVSKRQTAFWRRAMASKRLLLNACGARIRA